MEMCCGTIKIISEMLKCRMRQERGKEMFKNAYLNGVMETVIKRNPAEPEFHQAVREVLESLEPVIEAHP